MENNYRLPFHKLVIPAFLFSLVWLSLFFFLKPRPVYKSYAALPGDCGGPNGTPDGFVDLFDYGNLSRSFGLTQGQPGFNAACDFYQDTHNIIDLLDYGILAQNFGRSFTPTPATSTTPTPPQSTTLQTYPPFGGSTYQSPDYEVTLQQGNSAPVTSFSFLSFMKNSYPMYDGSGNLIQNFTPRTKDNVVRHSTTIFSFGGTPVTVKVKIRPGTPYISLPLTSCKILPSSYNIPCTVSGTDTMVFTLNQPRKVFVIPNYQKVWNQYSQLGQGHCAVSAWREYSSQRNRACFADVTNTEISEGYKNPFLVLAHPLEDAADIPSRTGALIVNPGQTVTQSQIDNANVVWFTPGVHDYSNIGQDPGHQIVLHKGQTVYIEGGAYVMARFTRNNTGSGTTKILGRGIISGIKHKWVKQVRYLSAALLNIDTLKGITVTDRAAYGIERIHGTPINVTMNISDIAMIGAWHGNTDSIEGLNAILENSLLIGMDDNLKMLENFQARKLVIWQGWNAHPLFIHENTNHDLSNSIAEDIDVVAYTKTLPGAGEWEQISASSIAGVRGGLNSTVRNFAFRNIRIESPYLIRVLDLYNLNTNLINPGWFSSTSETNHSKIDGIIFENITVSSPVITFESLFGSAYANSFKNVFVRNLNINGTQVTEANKEGFFEFEGDLQGILFQ